MAVIGKTALGCIEEGDTLRTMQAALRRLVKHDSLNTVQMRRALAAKVIDAGGYPL